MAAYVSAYDWQRGVRPATARPRSVGAFGGPQFGQTDALTLSKINDAVVALARAYRQKTLGTDTLHDSSVHVVMRPGESLSQGQFVWNADGSSILILQNDGNLVWYDGVPDVDAAGKVTAGLNGISSVGWSANTQGRGGVIATFQGDGNFVLYDGANKPVWASGSTNGRGKYLSFGNDGNLCTVTTDVDSTYVDGKPLWCCCKGHGHTGSFFGSLGDFFTSTTGILTIATLGLLAPVAVIGTIGGAVGLATAAAVPAVSTAIAIENPKVVPDILSGNITAAILDTIGGATKLAQDTGIIAKPAATPTAVPIPVQVLPTALPATGLAALSTSDILLWGGLGLVLLLLLTKKPAPAAT